METALFQLTYLPVAYRSPPDRSSHWVGCVCTISPSCATCISPFARRPNLDQYITVNSVVDDFPWIKQCLRHGRGLDGHDVIGPSFFRRFAHMPSISFLFAFSAVHHPHTPRNRRNWSVYGSKPMRSLLEAPSVAIAVFVIRAPRPTTSPKRYIARKR